MISLRASETPSQNLCRKRFFVQLCAFPVPGRLAAPLQPNFRPVTARAFARSAPGRKFGNTCSLNATEHERKRIILTGPPRRITEEIRQFAKQVSGAADLRYVTVKLIAEGALLDCLANVDRAMAAHGGSTQHGWIIWEIPGVLLEAEFHVVWRQPGGGLLDVTPQRNGEERLLFASDSVREFEGEPIDNVRIALDDHPLVHEFIARGRRRYEMLQGVEGTGYVTVPVEEYEARLPNQDAFGLAFVQYALGKRGRNDACYCGSRRKLKKCCGAWNRR